LEKGKTNERRGREGTHFTRSPTEEKVPREKGKKKKPEQLVLSSKRKEVVRPWRRKGKKLAKKKGTDMLLPTKVPAEKGVERKGKGTLSSAKEGRGGEGGAGRAITLHGGAPNRQKEERIEKALPTNSE